MEQAAPMAVRLPGDRCAGHAARLALRALSRFRIGGAFAGEITLGG